MTASQLADKYIKFFEDKPRNHKRIANSSLVPHDDPTTLFTSSGMQPLISYLLGQEHPQGKRLVNVQNSFRAQDIEEVGDNRHTTFFRMLGNWSLGDYFKAEEIPWLWDFLTKELELPKDKLYISIFKGDKNVVKDSQSEEIWKEIFEKEGLEPKIFEGDVNKNWWSRSGVPSNMPAGEPGGPDTEVYFRFDDLEHEKDCKDNPIECECGKFLEIANAVFMEYIKQEDGSFKELPTRNVDFGGGLERLLAAVENKSDVFQTSLFRPIIGSIEKETGKQYKENENHMRVVTDHMVASVFISINNVKPSNKEQGYILRRLIRRGLDHFYELGGQNIESILEIIINQYKETDLDLVEKYETIKLTIQEEELSYKKTRNEASKQIEKELTLKWKIEGGELKGEKEIPSDLAFKAISTYGLGPMQLKSLGYTFNEQELADQIKKHQDLSRTSSSGKFKGGLADHTEKTIHGHTATHLLHQALRDVLGNEVHQTGSNITSDRIRFDFKYDKKITDEELKEVEEIVNKKIEENLPVHFEIMPLAKAKELGAIGLFDEKYQEDVKIYFIGDYSKEFCGGPHVEFTSELKTFKIIKQDSIGQTQRRIYSVVG